MEVHHHAHHGGHTKKKFKEYISEFFMLFFAVFLGFMSEFYLEYRSERHKEHDYLISLVSDLKSDTAEMAQKQIAMKEQMGAGNSINNLIYKNQLTDQDIDSIYMNSIIMVTRIVTVNFALGTIDQLKSAGGYRLIRDHHIVNLITDYDKGQSTMKTQENALTERWAGVHHMQNKILHLNAFSATGKFGQVIYDKNILNQIQKQTGSKFLTKDKNVFYEFANYVNVSKGYVAFYKNMTNIQNQKAIALINAIEEDLKNN
jgi:hypothetical protein